MSRETCCVSDCGRPVRVRSRRLCNRHYVRWRRHGDPTVHVARTARQTVCPVHGEPWEKIGSGPRFGCKVCNRSKVLQYQKTSASKVNARHRQWKSETLPNGMTRARVIKMWERYQLSLEDYVTLLTAQNGRCAICRVVSTTLVIDHDHETDKVRGLLCKQCNFGIGLFSDDVLRMRAAARYIEEHLEQQQQTA